MPAETLAEIREEIAARNRRLKLVFDEAGPKLDMGQVRSLDGDNAAKVEAIRALNKELSDLGKKRDQLADLERMRDQVNTGHEHDTRPQTGMVFPGAGAGHGMPPDSPSARLLAGKARLRQIFAEHRPFQEFEHGRAKLHLEGLDWKTLITLETISPPVQRLPMEPAVREERTIIDLMNVGALTSTVVEWYEYQGLNPNAAAEVAEGALKPESGMDFELKTATATMIVHWIPLTKQAIRDNDFLEAMVRSELAWGVRRREELQVISGNGTAPNIRGILNTTGIQTVAAGANIPNSIFEAIQLIRGATGAGFAEPTAIVMHPGDWGIVRLLTTSQGLYIWGQPNEPLGSETMWGLPVRLTTGIGQGTAIVGAFRPYAHFLRRGGIDVILSTEHADFVITNKVLLLAESDVLFYISRPAAFCTVTGITAPAPG
jgi:Phage capsid family